MQQPLQRTESPDKIIVPDELSAIARMIKQHWTKIYYGAIPYVEAMLRLRTINDSFECDTAKSIVLYFLGNAKTWRGETAKAVKAKLKSLLEAVK
jgi:hypothetical protein